MSLDQELLAQIDKYKEIMQKDPDSREFLTLADLYRKLGVAEEATNILKEGLKKHPDYVDARLAVARIYLTQGQVEDATREFEEVIRQDTANFVAYKLLGEIAMQKQEHEKAAERFGAAYQLKPDDQECKVMLDYIGSLLGRDVLPQAGVQAPAVQPEPPRPPSGETIAVSPEGEFGEFEAAEEEIEEFDESEEFGEEAEEFGEVSELDEMDEMEEVDTSDLTDLEAPAFEESEIADLEDFDEDVEVEIVEEVVEELEEAEEEFEEEFEEIEEIVEDVEEIDEVSEIGEFEEEIEEFEEDFLGTDELPEMKETEAPEPLEESSLEDIEDIAEGDEELVTQIFQDLSDSQYTSEAGITEESDNELDDLMGLLDSEETESLATDFDVSEPAEQFEESFDSQEAEQDLESLIDFEGVSGMEEVGESEAPEITDLEEIEELEEVVEEIEEIEGFEEVEEVENLPEAGEVEGVEEVEDIGELEEIEEFEETEVPEVPETEISPETEGGEASSIFDDFGISSETAEAEPSEGEGDVFQDFDFDVFEQELLKDHPPHDLAEALEEPESEEQIAEEKTEIPSETFEVEELEEFPEEEMYIEEEFEEGEAEAEEELPDASLAELYIKQDLFGEATDIYRRILQHDPTDTLTKQLLEETLALQAYVEGME